MTQTTIRAEKELVSQLKDLKEAYGYHSLNELVKQLVVNAKLLLLLKTEGKSK